MIRPTTHRAGYSFASPQAAQELAVWRKQDAESLEVGAACPSSRKGIVVRRTSNAVVNDSRMGRNPIAKPSTAPMCSADS